MFFLNIQMQIVPIRSFWMYNHSLAFKMRSHFYQRYVSNSKNIPRSIVFLETIELSRIQQFLMLFSGNSSRRCRLYRIVCQRRGDPKYPTHSMSYSPLARRGHRAPPPQNLTYLIFSCCRASILMEK